MSALPPASNRGTAENAHASYRPISAARSTRRWHDAQRNDRHSRRLRARATTNAVAVPIYQTVAYAFDSADHGAALFNLEAEGFRYSRISNPTTAVLERRVAALEGGVEALARQHRPGGAELCRRSTSPSMGSNIVSVPQLYGTTHTLFAHILPSQGITVRFAEVGPAADAIEKLIDDNTRGGVLRERRQSGRQRLRHRGAGRGRAQARRAADRRQHRGDADPAAADRLRRRHRRAFADQVHGRPRHHARRRHRRQRQVSLEGARRPLSDAQRAGRLLSRPGLHRAFRQAAYIARCRSVYQRTTGAVLSPFNAFLLLQGIETVALRVERHVENAAHASPNSCATIRASTGSTTPALPDSPYHALAQKYLGGQACSLLTFGVKGGFEAGKTVLRRAQAGQAAGQYRRRQVAGLPSGLDHPPADVGGGAAQSRRAAGDDPAQRSASSTSTTSSPISIRRSSRPARRHASRPRSRRRRR